MEEQAYHSFYKQRVQKEKHAKNHFDKVVHIHQQNKMLKAQASGFSGHSTKSRKSNIDIMRQRSFTNQAAVTKGKLNKPFYFMSTSNGLMASNPNTIRDMGKPRNCQYMFLDTMDSVNDLKWRDIVKCDKQLDKIISPSETLRHSTIVPKGSFFLSKDQKLSETQSRLGRVEIKTSNRSSLRRTIESKRARDFNSPVSSARGLHTVLSARSGSKRKPTSMSIRDTEYTKYNKIGRQELKNKRRAKNTEDLLDKASSVQ